jgi:hypothetical protein
MESSYQITTRELSPTESRERRCITGKNTILRSRINPDSCQLEVLGAILDQKAGSYRTRCAIISTSFILVLILFFTLKGYRGSPLLVIIINIFYCKLGVTYIF